MDMNKTKTNKQKKTIQRPEALTQVLSTSAAVTFHIVCQILTRWTSNPGPGQDCQTILAQGHFFNKVTHPKDTFQLKPQTVFSLQKKIKCQKSAVPPRGIPGERSLESGNCWDLSTGSQYQQGADKPWAKAPSGGNLLAGLPNLLPNLGLFCLSHSKPKCWELFTANLVYSQGSQERWQENKSQIFLHEGKGFRVFMGWRIKKQGSLKHGEYGERWLE